MKTIIEKVNPLKPEDNMPVFDKAAEIILSGGLVAFPTETVYGLGADALNEQAVKKIYLAKGRPSDNPLIVHISSMAELDRLVSEIPPKAKLLAKEFWPGPLTLIFKKKPIVPAKTSGGLDTVAIRFPQDKTAQLFIERCGTPVAAPSANSSGKPSPTRASHVEFDLNGKIDMIIDGGASEFGLESTIVDVTEEIPCLLRPGTITPRMLEEVVGEIIIDKAVLKALKPDEAPKAPGMKYTHYSPNASVTIVSGKAMTEKINELCEAALSEGLSCGVLAASQSADCYNPQASVLVIGDRLHPETIASNLFKMLRKCDYLGINRVFVEDFGEDEVCLAIMNRLKKAAGYNIVEGSDE